jgi:hypothetical protein
MGTSPMSSAAAASSSAIAMYVSSACMRRC